SCPCLRGGPPSCSQWKMADLRYQSVKHKGLAIRLACDAAKSLVVRALPEKTALAQLVEHIIRNDGVACSSHASGTIPVQNYELGGPTEFQCRRRSRPWSILHQMISIRSSWTIIFLMIA